MPSPFPKQVFPPFAPGALPALLLLLAACSGPSEEGGKPLRNLLVITLDTVRHDHLSIHGGGAAVPNLERLAADGVQFNSAFTVAPITLPAHASLFTGLYPAAHGVRNNTTYRLGSEARTLAEILKEQGFRTAAVIGGQVLESRYGLDQGFDLYDDEFPPEEKIRTLLTERPAAEVVDRGLAWLREPGDSRWFLWLHLFDPHWEYDPPEPFRARYADSPYDGEIAYADQELGRLFDHLRGEGELDDTVIIVTSDHGESLGEHGESTHGLFLYEAAMHVPLIVRAGVSDPPRSVDDLVRLIDIFPTALDLLGLPPESSPIQGASMAAMMDGKPDPGRVALLETWLPRLDYGWSDLSALRDAEWKYIRAPRPELYSMRTDRAEEDNRVPGVPAEEYRARLASLEESLAGGGVAERQTPDPAARRALESLGYLSLGSNPANRGDLADPKDRVEELEAIQQAVGLAGTGQYYEAIPRLRVLVERNPGSGYLRGHLGNALRSSGRVEEGIAELLRASELEPGDYGFWNDLGNAYRELGDPEKAAASFRRILEINPGVATAYHNLAQMDQEQGNIDSAISLYEQALQLDLNLLRSLQNLGVLYQERGRLNEALALYLRIAELDPENARAFYSAAFILQTAGRFEESLIVLEEAQNKHPVSPLPHYYKAQVLSRMGDLEASERELVVTLQLDPGNVAASRALAQIREKIPGGG